MLININLLNQNNTTNSYSNILSANGLVRIIQEKTPDTPLTKLVNGNSSIDHIFSCYNKGNNRALKSSASSVIVSIVQGCSNSHS